MQVISCLRLHSDQIRWSGETLPCCLVVWVSFNTIGPIVWCQLVSAIPPLSHGSQSLAGRRPLYLTGCCSIAQPAAVKKSSWFQLFSVQPAAFFGAAAEAKMDGLHSWMNEKKPAFSPDYLIWSEYNVTEFECLWVYSKSRCECWKAAGQKTCRVKLELVK